MNLYIRLFFTWLRAQRLAGITPRQTSCRRFRVLPNDIDVFGHMNNGRFFQIMDIARLDWMLRTGVWSAIRAKGWRPTLGGSLIHYRRSLRPLRPFSVETRLLGYEGPWILLEHTFYAEGRKLAAIACTRATMRDGRRLVSGREVFLHIDADALELEAPEYVRQWLAADRSLYSEATTGGGATPDNGVTSLAEVRPLQARRPSSRTERIGRIGTDRTSPRDSRWLTQGSAR